MSLSFALSRKQTRRSKRSTQNQMTGRGHIRRNRRWHRPRRGQGHQERWRYEL